MATTERSSELKIHRELEVLGKQGAKKHIRAALCAAAAAPWRNAKEREDRFRGDMVGNDDFIAFERVGGDGPDAGVFMAERPLGYSVPNIVPLEAGRLSRDEYNAVLLDFVESVVEKAADATPLTIALSDDSPTLETLIGLEPAKRLRNFSATANRSTGTGHPSDERMFHAFVVAAYEGDQRIDPNIVERWLSEGDGWQHEAASKIAVEYEQGLALLRYYDEYR